MARLAEGQGLGVEIRHRACAAGHDGAGLAGCGGWVVFFLGREVAGLPGCAVAGV